MKRISILFIIIALMIGVSGCMDNSFDDKKTSSNELVDYMNGKYDDTFSYKAPFGGGVGADSKQILVLSEKYPEYDIWVEKSATNSEYNDNYTDYKLKSAVEEIFLHQLEEIFNRKAFVVRNIQTSGSYARYDSKTTASEYLNTPEQNIGFSAVIAGYDFSKREQAEKKIVHVFENYKANIYGSVYFIEKEEDVNTFFNKELTEQQKYPYVKINKMNSDVVEFNWR